MTHRAIFLFFALSLLVGGLAHAQSASNDRARAIPPSRAVLAQHGMVVAQEGRAARIGVDILERGGNAVDAAVAVGFAMAVSFPRAGNLGGGGFMVIHLAKGNRNTTIDYRETAPMAATPSMFLDAQGHADPHKSRDTGLAVGVPGTVAGLALAERKYGSGKFTLAELIAPALNLAHDGFPVGADLAAVMQEDKAQLARWPSTASVFVKNDQTPRPGDLLVQPDLADTLQAIAKHGPRAFYTGRIAHQIAAAVEQAGGIMTVHDLATYRAMERKPAFGTYRDYQIAAMQAPSSGGLCLIEMLNILEGYPLGTLPRGTALHYMIEAMKHAYADRALFIGDPDFVKVPVAAMSSKAYAASLRRYIGPQATPAIKIHSGEPAYSEGHNTTHFSVIDRDGNAVANTYTLNFNFGLGLVAAGTGVMLNNELDDFTTEPATANALVGFDKNLPGPGKRPLSSMTPTIVLKGNNPFLITGSSGGSRIITAVLQVITNVIDFHVPITQAVSAPRLHNQWRPEGTYVELGFGQKALAALTARGHIIKLAAPHTNANSIGVTTHGFVGVADKRSPGATAVGY